MFVRGKEKCMTTTSLSSTERRCITFSICMKNGIKTYVNRKWFIIVKICGRAIWNIISEAIYRKCRCGEYLLFFMFSLNHLVCHSIAIYCMSMLVSCWALSFMRGANCHVSSQVGNASYKLVRKEGAPVEYKLQNNPNNEKQFSSI